MLSRNALTTSRSSESAIGDNVLTLNEERRVEAQDRRVVVFADKAAIWEGRGAAYGAISR